jgi:hypothetical protein
MVRASSQAHISNLSPTLQHKTLIIKGVFMKNKRRTKTEWLHIFDEQFKSGLTIKGFCERHGIHLQTFRARKSEYYTEL